MFYKIPLRIEAEVTVQADSLEQAVSDVSSIYSSRDHDNLWNKDLEICETKVNENRYVSVFNDTYTESKFLRSINEPVEI